MKKWGDARKVLIEKQEILHYNSSAQGNECFIQLFELENRGGMIRKSLVFLIAIGFSFISLLAQERLRCKQISLEQGLSQSSVYSIIQDKKGFIWFGTQSGLNRYDGYQLKSYTLDLDDSHSLSNNYILSLLVDSSGALWVGTDNGVCRYIDEKDHFVRYQFDLRKNNSLSGNHVFALVEDSTGSIWAGTNNGLNRLDRNSGRFRLFQDQVTAINASISSDVRAILQDQSGFLWLGTNGSGLIRINPQTRKVNRFRHAVGETNSISSDAVLALHEDQWGYLWVGTHKGLDRFDPSRRDCQHYRHNPSNRSSLSNDWINCLYRDRSGALWIGSDGGGVSRYLPETNDFINFCNNPGDENSLAGDRILSIFEDNSGNMWFGTYGNCISKFNKSINKFRLYRSEPLNPNSLSNNDIRQIFQESQNVLWVATDGGGLNRIDRATGKYTVYKNNPSDPHSISSNRVFSILKDREGTMWITTADGGLNRFDPQKGKFVCFMNDPRNPQSISQDFVRTLIEDRNGYLWLGTQNYGLNRFDKKTGLCKRFLPEPGNPDSLSSPRIFSLVFDQFNILWIGTYGGGLNRFDPATQTCKVYRHDAQVPNGIKDNNVLCLNEDSRGFLWLGTSQGLTRFDRRQELFHTYTERDGLPDKVIYAIVEDNQKNLWVTTNRGLSRFNPFTEKFSNYDVHDGLQSNEFNNYSYCKGNDGELFFGGVKGFNSFYPEQITDNPHIPAIVLTRFQLFNNDVCIGKKLEGRVILNQAIEISDRIKLSYKQNVFSFEFSALDYKAPEKNQYAYMMVGLDRDWNYTGNRRFAAFSGIPPGEYSFRVKGSNNDHLWNNNGATLKITITPPFWQTLWFYGLSALLIIGAIMGFIQMRIRWLIRAKHELEQIVAERTKELERLSIVAQETDNAVIIMDEKANIEWINHGFSRLYGLTLEEFQIKSGGNLITASLSSDNKQLVEKCIRDKKTVTYELPFENKKGEKIYSHTTVTPICDTKGNIKKLIAINSDISGRKIAEDKIKSLLMEKEIILKEVHHRIKNNMATISGIFTLQANTLKNPDAIAALKDASSRVQSMVVLYDILYQSAGFNEVEARIYLSSLVDEIVVNFPDFAKVKIEKNIADFVLSREKVQPLGIIVNELLTNIMKYAFVGRSNGVIRIAAAINDNRVSVIIQDNGIGMLETVDFENSTGFGLKLVRMLIKQIAGTIRVEHGDGTMIFLEFDK